MYKQGNVTVMVSDVKKSVQFYADLLGFQKGPSYGGEWAEIRAPGITIGLHPMGKNTKPPTREGHMSLGFNVEDLDEATKILEQKGIKFTFKEDEAGRFAFFQDPDRTPLYLCEFKFF